MIASSVGVRERVWDALGTVYDPELDEPITSLRFVAACSVGPDGDVSVRLRLPTPQCAPNFAFLMAADAREAVRGVPGVRSVSVSLEDHYTGEEINSALAADEGFTGAFPGETDDDSLASLRELFQRKALVARQAAICEELLAGGIDAGRLAALTVSELPGSPVTERCLELRSVLGIPTGADAPAFVSGDGRQVRAEELTRWLRMGRLIRTSLEANGGLCRSLLQFRHALDDANEEVSP